ncbi:MAG: glycosyltransferase [Gemmatimonadales bacterium]
MSNSIVVIPCYNEAERLDTAAFSAFAAAIPDVRLLFVDDGSTDDTLMVLEQLRESNPTQLLTRSLPENRGKAEAVRHGLLEACAAHPDYVGFWDADLATPLEDIPVFTKLMDDRPGIEMVFGSRVNLLGRHVHRNLVRHYLGRVFATAAAATLGVGIYDTQCGAKLFRVTDGFVSRLQEPFIGGWIFDVEMIAREIRARRASDLPPVRDVIFEYPLMVWRDVKGSKLRLTDWFVVAATLARIYWKYIGPGSRTLAQSHG